MNLINFLRKQKDSLQRSKNLSKEILQTMLAIDEHWVYTDVGKNIVMLSKEIDEALSNIEREIQVQTGPHIFNTIEINNEK